MHSLSMKDRKGSQFENARCMSLLSLHASLIKYYTKLLSLPVRSLLSSNLIRKYVGPLTPRSSLH